MGLFSSSIANITINYHGQKRRNKVIPSVQTYYNVTFTPPMSDPYQLGDLYGKLFNELAQVASYSPTNHEVFWAYTNDGFQRLVENPASLLYPWEGFSDLPPLQGPPGIKPVVFIKLDLMDNGKTKFKITENAAGGYYIAVAPLVIMQTIRENLTAEQFAAFYQQVRNILMSESEKQSSNKNVFTSYDLDPMPVIANDQEAAEQVERASVGFCGNCGQPLQSLDGKRPSFCGNCGSQV